MKIYIIDLLSNQRLILTLDIQIPGEDRCLKPQTTPEGIPNHWLVQNIMGKNPSSKKYEHDLP